MVQTWQIHLFWWWWRQCKIKINRSICKPIQRIFFFGRVTQSICSPLFLAATPAYQLVIGLNRSQLDDRKIDCAGAIDETNTRANCFEPSTLKHTYLCLSTNKCISICFIIVNRFTDVSIEWTMRSGVQRKRNYSLAKTRMLSCASMGNGCGALGEDQYMCDPHQGP